MKNSLADFNFFYTFFRPFVDYGTYSHYRTTTIKGRENLPTDGPYIFAPCHQNALMDALLVLNITHRPVAFLARADIFKNPTLAAFLRFLRISPVYRIRDGRDQLSKNEAVFNNSRDVLLSGMPLCLMAEGTHNNKHQMLPLVKGMFRIAGETQKRLGDKKLYIVPVGFDYDEYQQTYSNICINIGKPISVSDFMPMYEENEPVALNQMRDALAVALKEQMHHVETKEHYDAEFAYCHLKTQETLKELNLRNDAWGRFMARKHISRQLWGKSEEEKAPLYAQGEAYAAALQRKGVPLWFASKNWNWGKSLLALAVVILTVMLILQFVGLKVWLLSNLIVYLPTSLLVKRLIKDTQFRSSVNYGIRLFVTFFYVLIAGIVAACCGGLMHGLLYWVVGAISVYVTPRFMVLLRDVLYGTKINLK